MSISPEFLSVLDRHAGKDKPFRHYEGESGYLSMLADVIKFGSQTPDRTNVGRRKIFGCTLRFDLRESFPSFTVRKTPLNIAVREFWAFLNGRPDIHTYLMQFGINIWEGNTTREFLDNRGLNHLPVGHGGKAYGFQYCNFNGDYDDNFMPTGGIHQIRETYDELKSNSFSSRLITSIWNPSQEKDMALPPCWWSHQFVVTLDDNGNKVLNLHATARSADILFGTPFNIQQFATYLAAMAKAQNMIAGELLATLVDAHVYGLLSDLKNHHSENNKASQMKYVIETLQRDYSKDKITLKINRELDSFESLLALTPDDLELDGFIPNSSPYAEPRPSMAV